MSRRGGAAVLTLAGAAVVGLVGGWLLAGTHQAAHREDLFASSVWRRFAALGWLERRADVDTLPLLRDYAAWEPRRALRRRALRIIAALEADSL